MSNNLDDVFMEDIMKDVAIFIPNRVLIFPDQVLKIALKSFIKFYFIKHVLNLFYSFFVITKQ